jgi:hypothetical protein
MYVGYDTASRKEIIKASAFNQIQIRLPLLVDKTASQEGHGHMDTTKTFPVPRHEHTASQPGSGNVDDGKLLAESDSLQHPPSHQTITNHRSTEDQDTESWVRGLVRASPDEQADEGHGTQCGAAADAPGTCGGVRAVAGHMAATKTVPLQSLESTASHRASGNVEDGELLAESDSLQHPPSHQTIPNHCSTLEEDGEPWDRGLVRASPDEKTDEGHGTQGGAAADAPRAGGGLRALAGQPCGAGGGACQAAAGGGGEGEAEHGGG